jgi:hypothetical protein
MKPDRAAERRAEARHLQSPPISTNCAGHLCWRQDGHGPSRLRVNVPCPNKCVVEFLGWRLVPSVASPCFL